LGFFNFMFNALMYISLSTKINSNNVMKNIYGVCRHVFIKFIKNIFIYFTINSMQHIERICNKTTMIKQISGYQNCKPIKKNC
jgi:hypothetical protein